MAGAKRFAVADHCRLFRSMTPTGAWSGRGMASGNSTVFWGGGGAFFLGRISFFLGASDPNPLDRPQHRLGVPLAAIHRRDMPRRQLRSHLPRRHPATTAIACHRPPRAMAISSPFGTCDMARCGLALQLPFLKVSESMGNHDSKIVDACSVD
jgi:hypothetical protein